MALREGPNMPRMVAIYGKGGVGKSTVSSNVSAALSHMGEKVMQVGCDPKRDSVATLCHRLIPTISDKLREADSISITDEELNQLVANGYNGVVCVESGGPRPGKGCAGRGVTSALQAIQELKLFQRYEITFAIFDVLGDVVCGGFAQPMRAGFARETYIVTTGELLTLYMTNNIVKAIRKVALRGANCGLAGLINNQRMVKHEAEIVDDFAKRIGVPVTQHVPRSKSVQEAESKGMTVIEAFPHSEQAEVYRSLAEKILKNKKVYIPRPVEDLKEISEIAESHL